VQPSTPEPIRLVVNWDAELKRKWASLAGASFLGTSAIVPKARAIRSHSCPEVAFEEVCAE